MLEVIMELNHLSLDTVYLGLILGVAFSMLRDLKPESLNFIPDRILDRSSVHLTGEQIDEDCPELYFIYTRIIKCIKRKEKSQDDDDAHIYFPCIVSKNHYLTITMYQDNNF